LKKISRANAIIISIVVGGICTVFMVNSIKAIGGPKIQMVRIKKDIHVIEPGSVISENDLTTKTMPKNFAENAFTNISDAVGKTAAYELVPGEPLLKSEISTKPMRDGLYQNEVGVRVQVDAVTYGGAQPGDYVDVLVQIPHGSGQPSTIMTLYRHIRVVAEFNSQGQVITRASQQMAGTPSLTMGDNGTTLPSYVELAVTTEQRNQLLSAGKVILSVNPWEISSDNTLSGVPTSGIMNQTPPVTSSQITHQQPSITPSSLPIDSQNK
jgi:Flp pilus assembly protein CpaB